MRRRVQAGQRQELIRGTIEQVDVPAAPPRRTLCPRGGEGRVRGGGRDIYVFDVAADKFLPLPGLNTAAHEYSPSLSPDGRYIAFVSERLDGEGERDIYLYDRQAQKLLPTPGLNSKADDFDPCVIVMKPAE